MRKAIELYIIKIIGDIALPQRHPISRLLISFRLRGQRLQVLDNKTLSERDVCTKFITPAIAAGGWSTDLQMREEVNLTDGRVVVRGNKAHRDKNSIRRADYVLYYKPGMPIAVVELKDNNHNVSDRNANCRDV